MTKSRTLTRRTSGRSGPTIGRVLLALTLILACADEPAGPPPPVTLSLVAPGVQTLSVGDTIRLGVQVRDQYGRKVEDPVVAWSSEHPQVAEVTASGLVTALAPGTATIAATAGGTASGTVQFSVSDPQYAVLLALYVSTGGDNWTRSDNWAGDGPLGDWYGVDTDGAGRVTGLNLDANNLVGRIPPELGDLSSLKTLDLSSNRLIGGIPAQLGGLAVLEVLLLGGNPLSGPLPLSLKELSRLSTFVYEGTDLCVPDDESLRTWLGSIADHRGTGVACGARDEGVCDRTPKVRDALTVKAGRTDCAAVTADDLAGITELDLSGPQKLPSVGGDCSPRVSDEGWPCDNGPLMADSRQTGVRSNTPELQELLSHDFAGLTALTSLDLQDNWLLELPDGVFDDLGALRQLDLSRNILTALPDGVFDGLSRVERIYFPGNRIAQLPDGVFDGLGDLIRVDFEYNQISELDPELFDGAPNLRRLQVAGNEIAELPGGIFDGLSQLGLVWFDYNRLTELARDLFAGSRELRWVSFAGNQIASLPEGLLAGNRELRLVSFHGNRIASLPEGLLAGLDNLTTVRFSGNRLTALPDGIFATNTNLNEVYFSSNEIGALPERLFAGLEMLADASFSNNRLTEVPPRLFRESPLLKRMDFEGNQLTALPDGFFEGLGQLERVNFRANPGTPFVLVPELRVERADPITVRLEIDEAVPFDMRFNLRATGTALSEYDMEIAAGESTGAITARVTEAPASVAVDYWEFACAGCLYHGLDVATGMYRVLANPPAATVKVVGAYLTQAAQNLDGTVPLVAGRDALLRVFVTADVPADFDLKLYAEFSNDTGGQRVFTLDPPRDGIPLQIEEGRLGSTYNHIIPGDVIEPGVEMVVYMRPHSNLTDESELVFPPGGTPQSFDVRTVAPLEVTVVPIEYAWHKNSAANDAVARFARDLASADSNNQLRYTRAVLPIEALNVTAREPYRTWADTTSRGGLQLLNEIQLLRHREAGGTDVYYHGLLSFPNFRGPGWEFGGIAANIPSYTALTISHDADGTFRGYSFGETFAHEFGHNVGLRHAPGCAAGGPDRNYPYAEALIGVWGYDPTIPNSELKNPNTYFDYMSYCDPKWVSDYFFDKSLDFLTRPGRGAQADGAPVRKSLVLWGGVGEGELQLDPPLVLDMPARLPPNFGPYRLLGLSDSGRTLFSFNFSPDETDHGGAVFLFALPFDPAWTDDLARIVLDGPQGLVTVERDAMDRPTVLIDRSTGRIRSIARDWTGELDAGPGVEVLRGIGRERRSAGGVPDPDPDPEA